MRNIIIASIIGFITAAGNYNTANEQLTVLEEDETKPSDRDTGDQYNTARHTTNNIDSVSDIPDDAVFLMPGSYSYAPQNDPYYYYMLPEEDETYYRVSEDTYIEYVKERGAFPESGTNFSSGYGTLNVSAEVPDSYKGKTVRLFFYERYSFMPNSIDLFYPEYSAEIHLAAGNYIIRDGDLAYTFHSFEWSVSYFMIADQSETYLDLCITPYIKKQRSTIGSPIKSTF